MNVRLAKPFGVRVGELVDRLEALSYRHGRPQFAISYCMGPAQQPAQWRATRVKVPPVELDGSRPTAPCLSRREAGRGKQLGY